MILRKLKKRKRYEPEASALEVNTRLEIDDITEYKNIFKDGEDPGFKGLKEIAKNRELVRLIASINGDENMEIEGTITHYDDLYNQLVVMSNGSLKRLVFDQIIDVERVNSGDMNEEVCNQ